MGSFYFFTKKELITARLSQSLFYTKKTARVIKLKGYLAFFADR